MIVPVLLVLASSMPARICAVVPKVEIEAAIGQTLGPAAEEYSRFEASCSYSGEGASVTIAIRQLRETLDLSAELTNLQGAFPGAKLREAELADARAFALEIPGVGTQIHAIRSEREYVLVSVAGTGEAGQAFEAAMKIAGAALSRRV
jgi:hypothetical protein